MFIARRFGAGVLALAFAGSVLPASAAGLRPVSSRARGALYDLKLPDGRSATVFQNGFAQITSKDRRTVEARLLQPGPYYNGAPAASAFSDKGRVMAELMIPPPARPFAPNRVLVVYRDGITTRAASAVSTNDAALNRILASIGVDRSERLFQSIGQSQLAAMRSRASTAAQPLLDIGNAYVLHVTGASVRRAVTALSKQPGVAYVSPDWYVSSMRSPAIPLQSGIVQQASRHYARGWPVEPASSLAGNLPSNYALTASAQSLLNAPSTGAAAAYSEVEARFNRLPGQGETITNISVGDLDDGSLLTNKQTSDPCYGWVADYGPTTVVQGGQRYLDLPSMPLIPTYTASTDGKLDGKGEVCGLDPYIQEIGLDFSMMAPLPHGLQRLGRLGSGYSDMLGIAPGAKYRLVVAASSAPTISDLSAALLAAGNQKPKPDVITASVGFGFDTYGFPSRDLEEDPLAESIVAGLVAQNIVVCISSGDGTRLYTTVAIGPSGGSAPTMKLAPGGTPTNVNDDFLSTAPSRIYDSGSIAVGGSTLDDIFARPPQYATTPGVQAQHAYAETRWTGFTSFSSGFGSRLNVSAPSDNVISAQHSYEGSANTVDIDLEGGTSASTPETAAAAAVLLQVARLTGHPFANPLAVRKLLVQTATPLPKLPQADRGIHVGPQIDLRAAVEKLLEQSGTHPSPGIARVAIEQRRDYSSLDGAFTGDTDPMDINLQNPSGTNANQLAWITIAPDWTFMPVGATYRLFVKGHARRVLATTPWARLLPAAIFQAAGLPIVSGTSHEIYLTYEALSGARVVARTTFPLVFTAAGATIGAALAPQVPPVVTGTTIPVSYDLTGVAPLSNPQLIVSYPGRVDPATGAVFRAAYTLALSATKGTVDVPVTSLKGGGIYGIGIRLGGYYSDFAFTRVVPPGVPNTGVQGRPSAPLLSDNQGSSGHTIVIPYNGSFTVRYDVSNVRGATGAMLEISAPGPGGYGNYNPFNNPNGSIKDSNGTDSGSVYYAAVSGTSGSVTLNASGAGGVGLFPTLYHAVRIIPTGAGGTIGEAGDVSTVTMDGVAAQDGGSVVDGFGVNGNGTDGFVTSVQLSASGKYASSLETFDQTTNRIVKIVKSITGSIYYTNGWGIYGADVGLPCKENATTLLSACKTLDTVSSGKLGSAWTPPFPATFVIGESAANQANGVGTFLALDTAIANPNDGYRVFTSNVLANTFSQAFDISGPTQGFFTTDIGGIAENTTTNVAYVPTTDYLAQFSNAPTIVTVDLSSGAIGSFLGVGVGLPYGIAVDSATNKAVVMTGNDDGLSFYDLAARTGSEVILPGSSGRWGIYAAADQQHALFALVQPQAPDSASNNNTLSRVLVYDESGHLQESLERFDLYNLALPVLNNELQLNSSARTGYLLGPLGQQLTPFKY